MGDRRRPVRHAHGWEYAPLESYVEDYKGMVTFWKFDRASGRILEDQSFALELPPYWQDLCDAGKLVSDGWIFCNSFNTELATGEEGPEACRSRPGVGPGQRLHARDRPGQGRSVRQPATRSTSTASRSIGLQTLIDEGILYFVPEPKSPHGVDVAPSGDYLVVSGKLDPARDRLLVREDPAGNRRQNWDRIRTAFRCSTSTP